jgi:valyl-tRNA synthetase
LIEEYGSEAVRYWACKGRPGVDTALDFGVMKIGRRLAIKLLNGARFAINFSETDVDPSAITERIDRSMLAGLAETVEQATVAFQAYDYTKALETAERSFWAWTDDYVELVKTRAYSEGPEATSAHAALQLSLSVYLRLFAPFLPFVTEEVWSWWRLGSIHRAAWPSSDEFGEVAGDSRLLESVSEVLGAVRRAKSEAKVSMRAEVEHLVVTGSAEEIARIRLGASDLGAAARAVEIVYSEGEFSVDSVLADSSR